MQKLTEEDFLEASDLLEVSVRSIKTVAEVESSGSGFYADGRPKILFEGHKFYALLKKKYGQARADQLSREYPTLVYPKWTKTHYKSGTAEYHRLYDARHIDRDCANMSASWGSFQILGENYKACKCESVTEFVERMEDSAKQQLLLFCSFIQTNNLVQYLKNQQWAEFARRYNGPAYKQNAYDTKLVKAYARLG